MKVIPLEIDKEYIAVLMCYKQGDEHIYPRLRDAVMEVINCRWHVYESNEPYTPIDALNLLYARERAKSLYLRYRDMKRRYAVLKA